MINDLYLAPTWTIRINGMELSEQTRLAVREIVFEERLTYTSKVELVIEGHEGFDLTMADLAPESELSLQIGWGGSISEEIFNGEIIEVTPEFEHERVATLTVIAYDRSYRLKKFRWPPEVYDKRRMADVVRAILNKYRSPDFRFDGTTPYFLDGEAQIKDYMLADSEAGFRPDDQTDWEFLNLIAEASDMMLLVRNRTIYFVRRDFFQQPRAGVLTIVVPPQLNFYYRPLPEQEDDPRGLVLYHFRPRNRALKQRDKVTVVEWHSIDAQEKKRGGSTLPEIRGEKNYTQMRIIGKTVEMLTIRGKAAQSTTAASLLAQSELERRARKFVEGQGMVKGWPYVRLGQKHNFILNDLGDFGAKFSGEYFIFGTEHRWTREEGYQTLIDVERKALQA